MKKSLLFSGVAITKFSKSFSNNELSQSFPRSPHCIMLLSVLVQQARKFLLLDKELKGDVYCNILCTTKIHHSFEVTCNRNN